MLRDIESRMTDWINKNIHHYIKISYITLNIFLMWCYVSNNMYNQASICQLYRLLNIINAKFVCEEFLPK